MNALKRMILRILALAVIVTGGYFLLIAVGAARPIGSSADAVTGASTIIPADQVSGNYVVLLNKDLHDKTGTTEEWTAFLRGESPLIMEDIQCTVLEGDAGGLEMAKSFQSRLPENQMRITLQPGAIAVPKAEHGVFDLMILSREAADRYQISALSRQDGVVTVQVNGGGQK